MWLALPLFILIALLLIGGLVAGGIYAAVLIPIAAIILFGGFVNAMWKRSTEPGSVPSERERPALPHTPGQNLHSAPSTPGEITDARRGAQ